MNDEHKVHLYKFQLTSSKCDMNISLYKEIVQHKEDIDKINKFEKRINDLTDKYNIYGTGTLTGTAKYPSAKLREGIFVRAISGKERLEIEQEIEQIILEIFGQGTNYSIKPYDTYKAPSKTEIVYLMETIIFALSTLYITQFQIPSLTLVSGLIGLLCFLAYLYKKCTRPILSY